MGDEHIFRMGGRKNMQILITLKKIIFSGSQGMLPPSVQRQIAEMEAEKKRAKDEKKQAKKAGKRAPSPTFDPKKEEDLDRAAAELAKKLAARMDMTEWRPPSEREAPEKVEKTVRIDTTPRDDTAHKSSIAVSEDQVPLSARSGNLPP